MFDVFKLQFSLSSQLCNVYKNIGPPALEKQTRLLESAKLDDLPDYTRQQLLHTVKHCHACRLQREKPQRFLFSIKDAIVGNFNCVLQIYVIILIDSNVLYILNVGTGFQNGCFLENMNLQSTWKMLGKL